MTVFPDMDPAGVHATLVRYIDTLRPWASLEELAFERERAPDDERHQVIAPIRRHVRNLVDQLAVLVDAVAWEVGGDVAVSGADGGFARAGLGHFQKRAGLGVALGEQQEVISLLFWQHDEVRLRVPGAKPACGRIEAALADEVARLGGRGGEHLFPNRGVYAFRFYGCRHLDSHEFRLSFIVQGSALRFDAYYPTSQQCYAMKP